MAVWFVDGGGVGCWWDDWVWDFCDVCVVGILWLDGNGGVGCGSFGCFVVCLYFVVVGGGVIGGDGGGCYCW